MYEKFASLLNENECSAYTVAKATGIPYTCLCDWKAGRSKPKADKLKKIADYFGVPMDYLMS